MKALTIRQTWATLIVLGHKSLETRSWDTTYKGPLLIHASHAITDVGMALFYHSHVQQILQPHGYRTFYNLPRGAVIGSVDLCACISWEQFQNDEEAHSLLTPDEQLLGTFGPGRFGWLFASPVRFMNPLRFTG